MPKHVSKAPRKDDHRQRCVGLGATASRVFYPSDVRLAARHRLAVIRCNDRVRGLSEGDKTRVNTKMFALRAKFAARTVLTRTWLTFRAHLSHFSRQKQRNRVKLLPVIFVLKYEVTLSYR